MQRSTLGPGPTRITSARVLTFLIAALATVWFGAPAASAQAADGSISGNVTDETAMPLSGICVQPYEASTGNGPTAAVTDSNGDYTLEGLADGDYRLQFFPCFDRNWVAEFYDNAGDYGSAQLVTVSDGAQVPAINAVLAPAARIEGRVTDEAGDPLAGICIYAQPDGAGGGGGADTTDADGRYSADGLAAGPHIVQFSECSQSGNLVGEYWDDKSLGDYAGADRVSTVAGQTTSGIDASLSQGGSIGGNVAADADSAPRQNICVSVLDGSGNSLATALTDAAGDYAVGSLKPGSYKVRFSDCSGSNLRAEYFDDKTDLSTAETVTVTAGQRTGSVNASLAAGVPNGGPSAIVSGRVTDETGVPLAGACVYGYSPTTGVSGSLTTDSDGKYAFTGVPNGSYLVRFSGCNAGAFATEWFDNAPTEAEASPVVVSGGVGRTDIDASLAPGATIKGRVVADATGDPLEGACVSANTSDYQGYGYARTDANGNYALNGNLVPGDYTVVFAPCDAGNYQAEAYDDRSLYSQNFDLVTLAEGQQRGGIDASLAPGGSITGRVTDENGSPLEGVCVNSDSHGTQTDADGNYTLTQLASGPTSMYFYPCAQPDYAAEFYDDELLYSQADRIEITAGSEVAGIDAQLALGGTISGSVRDESGNPIPYACITTRDQQTADYIRSGNADNTGSYVIRGVPAGSWAVQATGNCGGPYRDEYYDDTPFLGQATLVPVTSGGSQAGIDFDLSPGGGTIAGTVRDQGGAAIEGVCVAAIDPLSGDLVSDPAVSDSFGYFLGGLPVGQISIRFYTDGCPSAGDQYATEYWDDRPDLASAERIDMAPGEYQPGIDAVMVAPADTTAPETGINSGPSGTTAATAATFAFSADETGSTFECRVDAGSWGPCTSPAAFSDLSAGPHEFGVRATDQANNTDLSPATRTWTVDATAESESTSGSLPSSGGTVSSDPSGAGTSPSNPVTTSITSPSGGEVEIIERPTSAPSPSGFSLFDYEVEIEAPDATTANPLRLVFRIDSSEIPDGTALESITALRDGAPAELCSGAPGTASPDPCIADRRLVDGNDVELTILSSHASVWNLALRTGAVGSIRKPKVSADRIQWQTGNQTSVSVSAGAAENVTVKAGGFVTAGGRSYPLADQSAKAVAGGRATITLHLAGPGEADVQSALARSGSDVRAHLTVKLRNAQGATFSAQTEVILKRK